jgi:hypothetical protein
MAEAHHFSPRMDSRLRFTCHRPPSSQAAYLLRKPEKLMSPIKARCGLLVLAAIVALGDRWRRAESRPGQAGAKTVRGKLRNLPSQPARLAKVRFHLTLYLFLQKHYSSSSSSPGR